MQRDLRAGPECRQSRDSSLNKMASLGHQRPLVLALSLVSATCLLALAYHYNATEDFSSASGLAQVPSEVGLEKLRARNLKLKQEVSRASAFLKSLRHPTGTSLKAVEESNQELEAQLNQVRWAHAEEEHQMLEKELRQARRMESHFNPMEGGQSLAAWKSPIELYGNKPPGFNPLSEVTRADKSKDPFARPPLRVRYPSRNFLQPRCILRYFLFRMELRLPAPKRGLC